MRIRVLCLYLAACTAGNPARHDAGSDGGGGGDGGTTGRHVVGLSRGNSAHNCAVISDGALRCWGLNQEGQLGYGHLDTIGDDETPASAGDVDVGGHVVQVATGMYHTCALFDTGRIRCWGDARFTGYGTPRVYGDDESPSVAPEVELGMDAVEIAADGWHTCARSAAGAVRCWGLNDHGELGYGNRTTIGDDELPSTAGDVPLGGKAVQLALAEENTCARLDTGGVKCWGAGGAMLGMVQYDPIGDNETPAQVGEVQVGGPVVDLAAASGHVCAVLATGGVRCWGRNEYGVLGYPQYDMVGYSQTPAAAGDVDLHGEHAVKVSASYGRTCAVIDNGHIHCWGQSPVGYGKAYTGNIGDDEAPWAVGDVDVGGLVVEMDNCALLDTTGVRCWGDGGGGYLGYGNKRSIGDDETPAEAGDVPIL